MTIETFPFDGADYLVDDQDGEAFLTAVLEEGDPRYFMKALGTVARARGGIEELARKMGTSTRALEIDLNDYLSSSGSPSSGPKARPIPAQPTGLGTERARIGGL